MNDLIMIVEDDPYISHFLQMSFEQEGYRILMTTKGHEALSLFYSHQPDIVILDLGLPDIDGLEVIQEIRKISSKPIIVVSARLEEQEKIKALDLGANDYVVKPFYIEAMKIAEKGDFDLAKAKIKEGDQEFVKGHEAHAGLIQKEANGEKVVPNILLMHAEDQLMSAETIKMMALEIIKLNQRLYSLEK